MSVRSREFRLKGAKCMRNRYLPFASYNLWSLFSPAVGKEAFHCAMKRGFLKARKNETAISALMKQDTVAQQIGHLTQYGIYEFHRNASFLTSVEGVEAVAELLKLEREDIKVRTRVLQILHNYQADPISPEKEILQLLRGDEKWPDPILMSQSGYQFNLYAAFDCVLHELDGTIHILDFKTGKSDFDRRQAYVYLLAAQHIYPNKKAVASFYNVESGSRSPLITATKSQLEAVKIELMRISQRHQRDLSLYRQRPHDFSYVFSPAVGPACKFCLFNSICDFSL